jgi:hypothetical protein
MANPGPNIEGGTMTMAAIAPGASRLLVPFLVTLVSVVDATDFMTAYPLTFKGRLLGMDWVTHAKVSTAGKAATLSAKIVRGGVTTPVTGGALALTSALATPEGKGIAAAAITAGNAFNPGDALTLSWTGVTAFSEGTGHVILTLINDDTNNMIARDQGLFPV